MCMRAQKKTGLNPSFIKICCLFFFVFLRFVSRRDSFGALPRFCFGGMPSACNSTALLQHNIFHCLLMQ